MNVKETIVVVGMLIGGFAMTSQAADVPISTGAVQCPALNVNIHNETDQIVSGDLWGSSQNLGSSGYGIAAHGTGKFELATTATPGGVFTVNADVKWYGQERSTALCEAFVPIKPLADGCPSSTALHEMYVIASGRSAAACYIFTSSW